MYEYSQLKEKYESSFGKDIFNEGNPSKLKELTIKNKENSEKFFNQILAQYQLTKNLKTGQYE